MYTSTSGTRIFRSWKWVDIQWTAKWLRQYEHAVTAGVDSTRVCRVWYISDTGRRQSGARTCNTDNFLKQPAREITTLAREEYIVRGIHRRRGAVRPIRPKFCVWQPYSYSSWDCTLKRREKLQIWKKRCERKWANKWQKTMSKPPIFRSRAALEYAILRCMVSCRNFTHCTGTCP